MIRADSDLEWMPGLRGRRFAWGVAPGGNVAV